MVNLRPSDDDGVPELALDAKFDPDLSLAHLRSQQAAARLRSRNWNGERLRERTTIRSLLIGCVDLVAVIHTADGATSSGTVAEVGRDYVAVESGPALRWISLGSILAVESPSERVIDAELAESPESMLVDVLEDLIAAETILSVTLSSGAVLVGEAMSVGATLLLRNPARRGLTVVHPEAICAVQIVRSR